MSNNLSSVFGGISNINSVSISVFKLVELSFAENPF